ncbi:hypothetical protein QNA24_34295 [Rhodococcus qingshengii]|uniref:hypothetical protein n=1 Tax=Rhodococcus qingshengii TaxID=334542 RepID=UPI0024BA0FC5|nr:hypothetical protein [Rhodococcus qingshengii]MDJ0491453.1 hypothetical protein [Rhodococcus qingshengii]
MRTIDCSALCVNEVRSSAHHGRFMPFRLPTGKRTLGPVNHGEGDAVAATRAVFADTSIWLSWCPVDGVEQYRTVERCMQKLHRCADRLEPTGPFTLVRFESAARCSFGGQRARLKTE